MECMTESLSFADLLTRRILNFSQFVCSVANGIRKSMMDRTEEIKQNEKVIDNPRTLRSSTQSSKSLNDEKTHRRARVTGLRRKNISENRGAP